MNLMTSNSNKNICIIIPSLNPDPSLIDFIQKLSEKYQYPVVVVNDGSASEYDPVFSELESISGVSVLYHYVNLGKGRALKTAFNFCIGHFPDLCGVVTADADGQHLPEDILKCIESLQKNPDKLILGCREFKKNIPWKSKFGNVLTRNIFYIVSGGRKLTDTQTGLRGIPVAFMKQLMNCKGERFEFETEMLLSAIDSHINYHIVSITTVYKNDNRETHFDPLRDSIRIYNILFKYLLRSFFKFVLSSVSAAILDIALFALLFNFVCPALNIPRLFWSVFLARGISSLYNYFVNRCYVFKSGTGFFDIKSLAGYYSLCGIIFLGSYYGLRLTMRFFGTTDVVIQKIIVDLILFLLAFAIQRNFIFQKGKIS